MEANFKPDILIVDDIEHNIFTLRTLIEAHFEANLIEATSGEQVLHIVNEQPIDLILMDVMMPGMDGFETARLIKNRPRTSNIPIIFISAYDPTQKLLEKGIAAGGYDYLTKPIDDNQLVYRLKMYLRFIKHEFMMNLHLRELNLKLIEEIEDRKATELSLQISQNELKAANSSKDKFFSIIAHDLKNPFNGIIGLSSLLIDDYDSFPAWEQKEFIQNIKTTAENTFRLLQNLLEWSQTQTGKIHFEPTQFILTSITSDIVDLVKTSAGNKNIVLTAEISPEIYVFADKNMINTVLRNLLLNAVKFTRSGGRIHLSARKTSNMVEISVTDNGIGITRENINKLFCIDCNVASRGTEGEEGTGLGLILCKEFIDKNAGEIRIESEVGAGSTFTITIPETAQLN
ncbi:MAG: hybrid sensor histidine kinase/response regulator [Bacteroidetes bacterium]|nr:hybrid sensor histidine kinase/response regulator [Bacteroidota bacterium]